MRPFATMRLPTIRLLCLAWLATPLLPAQGHDPAKEIQEIARAIDEQMQEIDRLLLESSRKNQASSRPKELLQKAHEQGETVETGINDLIEKLNEMKSQGGSGEGQGQEPKDSNGQPPPKPGQGQSNRRENQTPDFVKPGEQDGKQGQDGQKPEGQQPGGEKPAQPKPSGSPQDGKEAPGPGQNAIGNKPPNQDTGPGQPGQGDGNWGELQSYVNFLKNRGSAPKVPEKYRKYWEAYLKNTAPSGGK